MRDFPALMAACSHWERHRAIHARWRRFHFREIRRTRLIEIY